jgi:hypothetical protein
MFFCKDVKDLRKQPIVNRKPYTVEQKHKLEKRIALRKTFGG